MSASSAPGRTVLYVEDEEDDVLFMRRAFKRAGLEQGLLAVRDGQEAIAYLAGEGAYGDRGQHPVPSMVLLDLNLPLVSGFEVLKWVRQNCQLHSLPVVVFSSSARSEDRAKAQQLGADEYVEKPSSGSDFVHVAEGLKAKWLTPDSPPAGPA